MLELPACEYVFIVVIFSGRLLEFELRVLGLLKVLAL
jgi:hypothetical protein